MPENKGGRPKTGSGHRDDAMLSNLDFLGEIAAYRREMQAHYRSERDRLDAMEARVIESSRSWRYGELVDEMAGVAAEDAR